VVTVIQADLTRARGAVQTHQLAAPRAECEEPMKRGTIVVVAVIAACARKTDSVDTSRAVVGDSTTMARAQVSVPDTGAGARADSAVAPPKTSGSQPSGAGPTKSAPASPAPASPSPASSDTVRGIVAVVGTEHEKQVIVRPPGARAITLTGPQALLVGRTAGADVWVAGTRGERNALAVTRFAVRTVDGIAAVDGTLTDDGGRLVLATPEGQRHAVANPPEALRQHVGARVWISGNLSQGPVAYGIIQDKP
jgi:hypothetical protein